MPIYLFMLNYINKYPYIIYTLGKPKNANYYIRPNYVMPKL